MKFPRVKLGTLLLFLAMTLAVLLGVYSPFSPLNAQEIPEQPAPIPGHVLAPKPAPGFSVRENQVYQGSKPVNLSGINWFGFETGDHVVQGLWSRNVGQMLDQIQSLGFNALRIPVCPATLTGLPVSNIDYALNPNLRGLQSNGILDLLATALESRQMYFVLDLHNLDCNASYTELWYTPDFSESQWIDSLTGMARRYASNMYFVGIDLKNEPHGKATWGTGNPATDWNLAAERAGKAVLSANANLLIFVEGVQQNPLCSTTSGSWWGGDIEPAGCYPISASAIPADKLVLSPHVYGPSLADQPYYHAFNFPANLPGVWGRQFGTVLSQGGTVIPGEWGGLYSMANPKDRTVLNMLAQYFADQRICSSFYWAWNPNSHDVGGILTDDWQTVDSEKFAVIRQLYASCLRN